VCDQCVEHARVWSSYEALFWLTCWFKSVSADCSWCTVLCLLTATPLTTTWYRIACFMKSSRYVNATHKYLTLQACDTSDDPGKVLITFKYICVRTMGLDLHRRRMFTLHGSYLLMSYKHGELIATWYSLSFAMDLQSNNFCMWNWCDMAHCSRIQHVKDTAYCLFSLT